MIYIPKNDIIQLTIIIKIYKLIFLNRKQLIVLVEKNISSTKQLRLFLQKKEISHINVYYY